MAGYSGTKITPKSDNKPKLKALKSAMATKRTAETRLIESPVRESKSNGHVERAVRNWRDEYSTIWHYLEHRMQKTMANKSPLSTWLVTLAADVINIFTVGIAFERHSSC